MLCCQFLDKTDNRRLPSVWTFFRTKHDFTPSPKLLWHKRMYVPWSSKIVMVTHYQYYDEASGVVDAGLTRRKNWRSVRVRWRRRYAHGTRTGAWCCTVATARSRHARRASYSSTTDIATLALMKSLINYALSWTTCWTASGPGRPLSVTNSTPLRITAASSPTTYR